MHRNKVRLSKKLSYLLRHGAVKEGLKIDENGWVSINDLLNHPSMSNFCSTLNDIREIVQTDEKQRYSLMTNAHGQTFIKANQGHSINVVTDAGMRELSLSDVKNYPDVVHGTMMNHLKSILNQGLSKMKRNHIHFAIGLPNDQQVISGARQSSNVFIFVDMKKAMDDGIKFYLSENKVILTSGMNGFLLPKYFAKIISKDGKQIYPSS
jgi:2'-phosphotransferase